MPDTTQPTMTMPAMYNSGLQREALRRRERKANDKAVDNRKKDSKLDSDTFIQCDLQYFNLPLLRSVLDFSFDVIVCDPPWRIRGQKQDSP